MRTDPSSRICCSFFSFDGPLGLRILNGSSAYQASPVMWHTSIHITLRLRKIRVDLPRRRRDLCYWQAVRMASVLIWEIRGRIKHPACSLAHCALSCRPQISRISTDFSHTKQAHRVTFSHTTLRLRKNPWQSVAPTAHQNQAVGSGARVNNPWKDPSVRIGDITSPSVGGASPGLVFFDKITLKNAIIL